jgi:hypothetical protein
VPTGSPPGSTSRSVSAARVSSLPTRVASPTAVTSATPFSKVWDLLARWLNQSADDYMDVQAIRRGRTPSSPDWAGFPGRLSRAS